MEHIDITTQVDIIAKFVTSPFFIWAWCALIGLYTMRWLLQIYWESLKINGQVKSLVKGLRTISTKEEFANQFERFKAKVLSIEALKKPFLSFEQHLTLPSKSASENSDVEKNSKNQPTANHSIKSHHSPDTFFNEETVIQPQIDMRFYNAIPAHLTGLGILGTFCGLAAGIYLARKGLAGGDVEEVQFALGQLLNGAALAFWTSIFGIFCSLCFSKLEKLTLKKMRSHINNLSFEVLNKINIISIESLLNQNVGLNQEQTKCLKALTSEVQKIHKTQGEIETKTLEKMVHLFNKSLTEKVGQEIKHIVNAFKSIHHALQATESNLKKASDQFNNQALEAGKGFSSLISQTGNSFRDLQIATLKEIQKEVASMSTDLRESIQASVQLTHENLKDPIDAYIKDLKDLNQKTNQSFEQWSDMVKTNQKQMSDLSQAHLQLQSILDPVARSTEAIVQTHKNSTEMMEKSVHIAKVIAQTIQNIDQIQAKQKDQWETYVGRFENVDLQLRSAIQTTQSGLEDYTLRVKEFTSNLDQHMSKGILTLATAVGDLHQVVGHIPDAIKDSRQ